MRGDGASLNAGPIQLVAADSLQDVPVFSPDGKKLGVLEGVALVRPRDAITYAILRGSRFMGLLKTRRLLRRNELTVDDRRGGFTIIDEEASQRPPGIADETGVSRRLDPARSG